MRGARDHLHPDGLPDAGRPRIPDGMRRDLPVLLAARFGEVVRVVFGANDELDRGLIGASGDVERERRIAALVAAEASAVDPDGGVVVDRAEVQQDPVALLDRWQNQRRAIPARAQERRYRRCRSPTFLARTAPGSALSHDTSRG